ncbi:MAG: AI-2E family transporter [Lachnospiraceae bacterium]|nr:AI-2E family transporter [Lachnospiraceae bacterium]
MKNDVWKRYFYIAIAVLSTFFVGGLLFLLVFRPGGVGGILQKLMAIPQPFIYGFVIAYLINPVSVFFEQKLTWLWKKVSKKEKKGMIRMCSVFLGLIFAIAIIALLLLTVFPQLVNSISGIISMMPDGIKRFEIWLQTLQFKDSNHAFTTYLQQAITTLGTQLQTYLETDLLPNMTTVITQVTSSFFSLVSVLGNFGVGCIVAVYYLGSKEKFLSQTKLLLYSLFEEKWADRIREEVHYTDRMFSAFIHGKLLDSAIIGLICFVFTTLAGTPYAMLVSIIVGVTNIIPFFGPYLGAIPSALLILMVSPMDCVIFLIFVIILQQVDGNIIGPSILGDKMGVSGFWVLFSILFFGSLWGLVGMLIGVPVFAVIYDILRKIIFWALGKRGQEEMITKYEARFAEESKPEKKKPLEIWKEKWEARSKAK